jgi:hypothetical protein
MSVSEEITKLLDEYEDGKLPRRDLVKRIAAMTGVAGGLAGLLFGGKDASADPSTDLELRKIIIERITNTRYDGGGNTGNSVSGIAAGRHVWHSEPELDPPYSAKQRHRDWALRRGTGEANSFKKQWVDALEREESNRHANDTRHPGKGAGNIHPSDRNRIRKFIDAANVVLGMDILDKTDGNDDPDAYIYEDVYHVLRRKIEVECTACKRLPLTILFEALNGGDDGFARETKNLIRGILEEPGDKWNDNIENLIEQLSAAGAEDGDWY